jgi:two-component system phosphate regulon response regulator PhoB
MSTKTVLIVDDEVHVRHVLGLKISAAGYVLLTASNGRTAYEMAIEHLPDGIITDFQMPGGDGLELCTRLTANPKTAGIPAMMLTARGHRITPDKLEHTNIWRLCDKPFSPRKIIEQLDEMLAESETRPFPTSRPSDAEAA